MEAVRRCGFCESTDRISREHVFATWIGPVVGLGQTGAAIQHAFRTDGLLRGQPWTAQKLDQKVRMACASCNNGWMGQLETKVKPIITPMIQTVVSVALDFPSQAAVAAWAIKTAMVSEFLKDQRQRYFTQAERQTFMGSRSPASIAGAHVWLACYLGGPNTLHCLTAVLTRAEGVAGHVSTTAIGHFACQVFVDRTTAGLPGVTSMQLGPWEELLVQIWPPHSPLVKWPSLRGADDLGLAKLFRRFSP